MNRILVTGVSGFVGACLAKRLLEQGYEVHVFTRNDSNKWRIEDLLAHVTEHQVDLRDTSRVQLLVQKIRPTIIYHLATHGGFAFQKQTTEIIESNLLGTINLLRACQTTGFDFFVNTGSSSEYGIKSIAMNETHLLEPIGDYGISKAAATLFCRSEAIEKDLPIVTLRLFSPYGPFDDPRRLIPHVIKSLLRGENPKLSRPDSVRDYIFIDDVLDAYLNVIKKPTVSGNIFNVGSGTQHSIGEVVSLIADIIGSRVTPLWGALESKRVEPEVWRADIDATKSSLDWKPSTSIRLGLQRTIEWMQNNLEFYP